MTATVVGAAGLALLVLAVVLALALDVPGGPAGWRGGSGRARLVLLATTAAVTLLALAATWLRVRP